MTSQFGPVPNFSLILKLVSEWSQWSNSCICLYRIDIRSILKELTFFSLQAKIESTETLTIENNRNVSMFFIYTFQRTAIILITFSPRNIFTRGLLQKVNTFEMHLSKKKNLLYDVTIWASTKFFTNFEVDLRMIAMIQFVEMSLQNWNPINIEWVHFFHYRREKTYSFSSVSEFIQSP